MVVVVEQGGKQAGKVDGCVQGIPTLCGARPPRSASGLMGRKEGMEQGKVTHPQGRKEKGVKNERVGGTQTVEGR